MIPTTPQEAMKQLQERIQTKGDKMASLGMEYPKEQARVRDIINAYRALPNNAGMPAALLMEAILREADEAAISGDVVAMVRAYEKMKRIEQ